jgi:PAS domain S-box-containing protein
MRHLPSAGQPAARRGRERRARSEPSGLLGSAASREPDAGPASDGDVSDAEALSLLRRVIDLLPHHIFVRDDAGRFLLANRALAGRYGLTPGDLEGRTESDLPAARPPDTARPAVEAAPSTEETFVDASGDERVLSTVRVPFQAGGQVLLGVSIDVTERRRAREQERRLAAAVESAARDWRATFDSMRAAVMVVSRDGVVRRANRTAADWLSVHVASLPGTRWADLARAEPWRRAAEMVEAALAGGRGGGSEVRDPESGAAWEIRVDPAMHGGDATVILSIRDVSEMVEVREWARRNESLAALGSVVAGVAHEVRNPMAAIAAHVEALALAGVAPSGQDESITALRAEVKRLSHLVTELLEYGRPRPSDFEPLALSDVVHSAIEACAPAAGEVDVVIRCAAAHAPLVLGDAGRLRRVFLNLVENAVQHSRAGGTVEVTVGPVEEQGRTSVVCRVADAGGGFTPDDLARAFEPFFTRRRGGTGLGLPIVRRILSDHGGTVEAGNRPEGGAFVRVSLPARETA